MTVAEKVASKAQPLEIEFERALNGAGLSIARSSLRLPLEWLAGEARECLFPFVQPAGETFGFQLFSAGDLLIGHGTHAVNGSPEVAAKDFYRRLFCAAGSKPLYRIWNYVPDINQAMDGL